MIHQLILLIDDIKTMVINKNYSVEKKSHGNFVTSVDIIIEHYLFDTLHTLCPEAGFISEESNHQIKKWNWVIDPIDGTGNFINGFPYTISIALINEVRQPIVGVVYSPTSDELFYAYEGGGAFVQRDGKIEKIHVGKFEETEGFIIFGMPYDRAKTHKILSIVEQLYEFASDIKRIGPASLDICRVAEGKAKIYVELDLNIWDYAAGLLILKEAGGIVFPTTENGDCLFLVASGQIYQQIAKSLSIQQNV